MFVVSNFIIALAVVINAILGIYWWMVIGAAILTWVNPDPYNPIVRFLRGVTEPVYFRIRRVLPLFFGGIDFTPILVLLLIQFLQVFLVPTLYQMAARLGGQAGAALLL